LIEQRIVVLLVKLRPQYLKGRLPWVTLHDAP
jgi:hypothetical protein